MDLFIRRIIYNMSDCKGISAQKVGKYYMLIISFPYL